MLEQYPYIIFDLGNTLIYFDGCYPRMMPYACQAFWQFFQQAGIALPQAEFTAEMQQVEEENMQARDLDHVERPTRPLLRHLLEKYGVNNLDEDLLRQAVAASYAVSQACWHPEADALPILQALKARGHRMGIVSNAGDDDDVQFLVDKAALRPMMDFVISSAAFGWRKPLPVIFEAALAHWGAHPSQAVMVGDRLEADVAGAHSMGMKGIWINRRVAANYTTDDIKHHAPDWTIDSLDALLAL